MHKADSSGVGSDWAAAGRRRQVRINAFICAGVATLFISLLVLDNVWLGGRELVLGDALTSNRGGGAVNEDLILVGIDDLSLDVLDVLDEKEVVAQPQLNEMSFGYPFPRTVYAALAEKLLDAGARLVMFDMIFTGVVDKDEVFKAVIDANPGKVVVGANLSVVGDERGGVSLQLAMPSESIVGNTSPADPRIGIVNLSADDDGKVRSVTFAGKIFNNDEEPDRHTFMMAGLKQLGKAELITEPSKQHYVRFPDFDEVESFYQPKPMYEMFLDQEWERNYQSGQFFKDKVVVVGGTSIAGFHDTIQVPYGEIGGPQMHLNTLAVALAGDFYQTSGKTGQVVSVLVLALIAFGIAFVMARLGLGIFVLLVCCALYFVVIRWVYFDFSRLLPIAAPSFTLGLAGLGCLGNRFVMEQLEKARLRRTLERQVSKDLAEHILSMPEDYYESLPGVRKPVTVLFSDIRGFTSRSEKADPVELVSQLRQYLDVMGEIVFDHRGVVDKFIGDAVMAVWGNLRSEGIENDTNSAVASAVVMMKRLNDLNAEWEKEGREPFAIGIGLNQGHAIFGMMGSEQKQEMTVIGDPVNQAARLESLTKKFGQEIIIGPQVAKYVKDKFSLRSLGRVQTMGKKESEELFGVPVEPDEAKASWLVRYHEALVAFNKGDLERAKVAFDACVADEPDDLTCKMYLDAIARGDSGGVLVMTGK